MTEREKFVYRLAYQEIITALQNESLGYAANFVTDLLIEKERKDAQEKEKGNEVGESDKDSSSGEQKV